MSPAILGGTELSLILCDETVFGVRILGTTQISVEAAVARLISGGAIVPIAEGRETPGAIDKSIARQLMFLLE